MARDNSTARKNDHAGEGDAEEAAGLLQESRDGSPDANPINTHKELPRLPLRRQSSFAKPRAQGMSRTPNRVRFDVAEPSATKEEDG